MCGIAGIVTTDPKRSVKRSQLQAMAAAIAHRGPDAEGFHLAPGVGLASRRLAIIDLQGGDQPLRNEDASVTVIYNGEIYNFASLREQLEIRGHRFATATDGEVLCHLYEQEGEAMLDRLRGMFAFALWDARRERLLLARDRFGIKPLYYALIPGGLAFASELKALLALPQVPKDLDTTALSDYLTYLYVPSPRTIFASANKLPPASLLTFEKGAVQTRTWWEPPAPGEGPGLDPEDAAEELRHRLRETVRAHLVSDVPVGAFLSGGLDSSTVVAFMAEASSGPVRTFTVGFEDAGAYDERPHARAVAEHFGCEHHELVLAPHDLPRLLPEAVFHLDEPMGDATAVASLAVARDASCQVKVVLTGVGGDEVFAGYRRYQAERLARIERMVPAVRLLGPLAARLPASGRSRREDLVRLAKKFFGNAETTLERRYLSWNAAFTARQKAALLRLNGRDSLAWGESFFRPPYGVSFASRAQAVDLQTYLPHDPLALTDATTMAAGLEGRVPLCDHRLVEWALGLPPGLHTGGFGGKTLLRRAVASLLPPAILRRAKRGFSVPTDLWLRGPLAVELERLLDPGALQPAGLFRTEAVSELVAAHRAGRRDFSQHLWALLVFQTWHRIFFAGSHPEHLEEVLD